MPLLEVRNFTPEQALKAFRTRLANPLPEFSWLDLWNHEHSAAFTVAKTAGFDVLGDIGQSLDDAIANGETLDAWRKKLVPTLQDKGWWGRGPAEDPLTGAVSDAQLGSLRRLEIIYDTNVRQAYAAGRWLDIEQNKADLPYLMYKHNPSRHPRPQHEAWDGLCLPVDHEFWLTHYPPNGWKCHCTTTPVTRTMFDRLDKSGRIRTQAPVISLQEFRNRRTGEISMVPKGIDPGFGYNAGKALLAELGVAA